MVKNQSVTVMFERNIPPIEWMQLVARNAELRFAKYAIVFSDKRPQSTVELYPRTTSATILLHDTADIPNAQDMLEIVSKAFPVQKVIGQFVSA